MHLLTKGLGLGWVGITGVIVAGYAGLPAAIGPALALLNYNGGMISPVSVLGGITLLWLVVDWRVGIARKAREHKAILKDKPGLANNKKGLARERKIRQKERKLQRQEERTLRAEARAEKRVAKDGRKETTIQRKRERIEVKKEKLRDGKALGRR